MPPPWKELACKRLAIPSFTKDARVLDELVRAEIGGGYCLLSIRDSMFTLCEFLVAGGLLTEADTSAAMGGILRCVQQLRTHVADKYRHEAEGTSDDESQDTIDIVSDPVQPDADYEDSKVQP